MRLLFVHGIGQQGKNPVELKTEWQDILNEGLKSTGLKLPSGTSIDFPFYGDKLFEFKSAASIPSDDVIAKGTGSDQQYEKFMRSALEEMLSNSELTESDVIAEMGNTEYQEKGIQNWGWVQAIARAIDNRSSNTSSSAIQRFLRVVHLYVNIPTITDSINHIVEELITDEPTVIFGHSLGTVVAYNVIRNNPNLDLCKFITVGSPLGIKAISTKLGIPENTAHNGWYNAYDERDIVALNPLDDTYFPTDPSIKNNNSVKNKTDNRHGIIGYLNDPKIAKAIVDGLNSH